MSNAEMTENEHQRRALAVEGALMLLIDGLASRGTISVDEAEDMLRVLASSSQGSAARASSSLRVVKQIRKLRRGDGMATPGA